MKLVAFSYRGEIHAGLHEGGALVPVVTGDAAREAVREAIVDGSAAGWPGRAAGAPRIDADAARVLAPIPEPRRDILCVGKNYLAHATEFHGSGFDSTGRDAVPEHPVIFTKAMTAIIGPGEEIRASDDPTASVDYEGELAVVIGRKARRVAPEDAFDYIFGYTILNDVTSRSLQRRHNQWVIGKGVDTFCPMGPWIASADELNDIGALRLETRVNGELRQDALVADLIFDIPTLIATLTATQTLLAGDIIATGTPAGVGIGFDPPRYLTPGDRVEVSITGLGTLENPVA